MDKVYRPERDGLKGEPPRNNPARDARLRARKERMMAAAVQRGQTVQIKPISNKEVNPVYRNQKLK